MSKDSVYFSIDELALAVAIIGRIDPDFYPHTNAKALIYKCKSMVEKAK